MNLAPAAAASNDGEVPHVIDARGFTRELDALRTEYEAELSQADFNHLRKMETWGRVASGLGYATAWMGPNLFSAAAMAVGSTARWAIVAHHVSHRALDGIEGVPARYTSRGFAKGARRYVDWLDWIHPEAWNLEHNVLHHFHTGETKDPDLVEDNAQSLRRPELAKAAKYAAVALYAFTWKFTYYAPNTFQVLIKARARRAERASEAVGPHHESTPAETAGHYRNVYDPRTKEGREFWKACVIPYVGVRFVGIPLAFSPLGPWAAFSVFCNTLMAEGLTNLHTFLIIAPNHAGEDVTRFEQPRQNQAEFYVRQVTGSVNYQPVEEPRLKRSTAACWMDRLLYYGDGTTRRQTG
jgi:Fatty acid desaturase